MASRFVLPFADVGIGITPSDGALLEFFITGTSTPKDTFTTEALTVANTNPVVADAKGVFPDIWLPDGARYKVTLDDKNIVQKFEADPVIGGLSSTSAKEPFDTVAAMVASKDLNISEIIETAGYLSKGDGGDNRYEIVGPGTSTADGGSFIDLTGISGQAKGLFPSGVIKSKQFNAKHDGSTDDRLALFNADAFGPVNLNSGTALVSSALTFTNDVTFESGAIIKPGSSITITFNKDLSAGDSRIFDLSNSSSAVANLSKVNMLWFAGHLLDSATDATAVIQSAYDACVNNAEVFWPVGFLSKTGSTATNVSKGQQTRGSGKFSSKLIYRSAATNGFKTLTTTGASFKDIQIGLPDNTIVPTSGISLDISSANAEISNLVVNSGFQGIVIDANGGGFKAQQFDVFDCFQTGVFAHDVTDIFFDQFSIVAIFDRLVLSSVTGTFTTSDILTGGTSGATGSVGEVVNSTTLRVNVGSKNFTVSETVTGSSSGATGTVVSQTVLHSLGGIRLFDQTEAVIFTNGDIIGGKFSITTDATVDATAVRPAHNKFTNVYFDSSDDGALFDKSIDFDFTACWFSNRPNNGAVLNAVSHFRFNGGGAINCAKRGILVNTGAQNIFFSSGFAATGNSTETANTFDGIEFGSNVNDFVVQGCRLGTTLGFGTQRFGVNVNAGTSDRYIIADNIVSGNGTAGVSDGGTGANKRVSDNF